MSYLRYYKREKITLQCRTVTPMFLGNAHQEAELRSAPFKALFRYWWRVTQHGLSADDLRKREGEIFGIAGEDDGSGKSLFSIAAIGKGRSFAVSDPFPRVETVNHPELNNNFQDMNPLLYLAGIGLVRPKGENLSIKHSYFLAGTGFDLEVSFPQNKILEMEKILALVKAFGTIGGRSRNGWGSFQVLSIESKPATKERFENMQKLSNLLEKQTRQWIDGLQNDFPNCLGQDSSGPLLWKTDPKGIWPEAMRELADAYIGVRARTVGNIPKLDPDRKDSPSERHLLGFPLQNHPANRARNWGNSGRHASPLRFVVHQINGKFQGFILHLPHRHSDEMPFPNGIDQEQVWEKVHRKLDAILKRATYPEVLA